MIDFTHITNTTLNTIDLFVWANSLNERVDILPGEDVFIRTSLIQNNIPWLESLGATVAQVTSDNPNNVYGPAFDRIESALRDDTNIGSLNWNPAEGFPTFESEGYEFLPGTIFVIGTDGIIAGTTINVVRDQHIINEVWNPDGVNVTEWTIGPVPSVSSTTGGGDVTTAQLTQTVSDIQAAQAALDAAEEADDDSVNNTQDILIALANQAFLSIQNSYGNFNVQNTLTNSNLLEGDLITFADANDVIVGKHYTGVNRLPRNVNCTIPWTVIVDGVATSIAAGDDHLVPVGAIWFLNRFPNGAQTPVLVYNSPASAFVQAPVHSVVNGVQIREHSDGYIEMWGSGNGSQLVNLPITMANLTYNLHIDAVHPTLDRTVQVASRAVDSFTSRGQGGTNVSFLWSVRGYRA